MFAKVATFQLKVEVFKTTQASFFNIALVAVQVESLVTEETTIFLFACNLYHFAEVTEDPVAENVCQSSSVTSTFNGTFRSLQFRNFEFLVDVFFSA
jgi:hypothetical protein